MLARHIIPNAKQQEDLDDLADRIRQAHDDIRRVSANALALALAAGDLLIEAKIHVPPKKWSFWLRKNCFMGRSTARLYVQLAQHRTEIEDEISRFPDLSLRAARRLITAKNPKPSAEKATTETSTAAPAPTVIGPTGAAYDAAPTRCPRRRDHRRQDRPARPDSEVHRRHCRGELLVRVPPPARYAGAAGAGQARRATVNPAGLPRPKAIDCGSVDDAALADVARAVGIDRMLNAAAAAEHATT